MLDAQGEILEGMASGAALSATAAGIALLVEKLVPQALCAIVLVEHNGRSLEPLAAPSLPECYFTTIRNSEIGPQSGSTGTAAFRRQPVIVADTASDPLWHNLQDFTEACGVRSSWALPILNEAGCALGVITLYYRSPRAPGDWDWSALNSCIKLVRLALTADRREQELRATDMRWRIGAEALGLGTFDIDFEKGIDKWSPALRQILGVGDEVPPSFESFVARIHPDDRAAFLVNNQQTVKSTPSGRWREELRICRGDTGEVRIIIAKGVTLCDDDGNPQHAIGTIHDVTEHRRREGELEQAKVAAEAANRAKSRFLASMSHELRTPLNAIIGFSDLIRSQVFGPMTPSRYESYIEDIHKSGTHLLSLINDVLDMAKIEAQKFQLIRARVRLQQLADTALMLVRPQALTKQITLTEEICDPNLTLDADERALRQVLVNLLSNAVKFTAPGGTVRLFAEQGRDGSLALGVEDNGVGMDAMGIAIAMEPFGQVQHDVSAERSGTGLGLPLAKAMIESHGAAFHIESELGAGTRIWANFPPEAIVAAERKAG